MTQLARIGIALPLLLILIACDPARVVDIRNATDQIVVVYDYGRGEDGKPERVEPGAAIETAWLWPSGFGDARKRVIEARTTSGELIFCREFGQRELDETNNEIVIMRDLDECESR